MKYYNIIFNSLGFIMNFIITVLVSRHIYLIMENYSYWVQITVGVFLTIAILVNIILLFNGGLIKSKLFVPPGFNSTPTNDKGNILGVIIIFIVVILILLINIVIFYILFHKILIMDFNGFIYLMGVLYYIDVYVQLIRWVIIDIKLNKLKP